MKKNYTFLLLLFSVLCFAQIPTGYYNTATGTGYVLKTNLYNKIKDHTTLSYTPGLWNLYPSSDAKATGKVWDIYSNCNFTFGSVSSGGNQDNGTGGTAECQLFNREHTFPKSWFDDASPMYTDAFHVMPTDKKVNGLRGNMPYGVVGVATYTSSNGCKIGNNVATGGPSLAVFEPADEYKGDIARNYFYMATCYQNVIAGWENNNTNGAAFLDGTNTKVYEQWALDMLYAWHVADPVSEKEINRNNAVYAVQGNRNPFIDHPEYVAIIWGTSLSTNQYNSLAAVVVYPNPSTNQRINIEATTALDEIQLINVNGQIMQQIKNPKMNNNNYSLENVPAGFYILRISNGNQSIVKKVIVN